VRYGFVEDYLSPNGNASRDEFFQVLVNFVGRFAQLKADMPQALLGFISDPLGLLRPWLGHFFIFIHKYCPVDCYGYSFISLGLVGKLSLVTRQFEWVLLKEKIVMMELMEFE